MSPTTGADDWARILPADDEGQVRRTSTAAQWPRGPSAARHSGVDSPRRCALQSIGDRFADVRRRPRCGRRAFPAGPAPRFRSGAPDLFRNSTSATTTGKSGFRDDPGGVVDHRRERHHEHILASVQNDINQHAADAPELAPRPLSKTRRRATDARIFDQEVVAKFRWSRLALAALLYIVLRSVAHRRIGRRPG